MRVNEQIRIPKVLVIDEKGQKLGVMDTADAIRLARSKGMDLIEVAPQSRPPVCRIMDYGKFKYQHRKREKESRKHRKIKEIRLTPPMSEHDIFYRLHSAEEFLREGHRVRVFMPVRGRWVAHMEISEAKLREFVNQLQHVASVEVPLSNQGNMFFVLLAPRKDTKKEMDKKAEATTKLQPPTSTPNYQAQQEDQQEDQKVIEVVSGQKE